MATSSKKPKPDDKVFLIRSGDDFRGIIARGRVAKAAYSDRHWDSERAASGETADFIDVEFEDIRDPMKDAYIPHATLTSKIRLPQTHSPLSLGPMARQRLIIECLFGDTKTRGLNLEDTRLVTPRKLALLLGIVALAVAWAGPPRRWSDARPRPERRMDTSPSPGSASASIRSEGSCATTRQPQ